MSQWSLEVEFIYEVYQEQGAIYFLLCNISSLGQLMPERCVYFLGCPLEVGDVPFDTKEFNFTSHLNGARESFTGRLWLYHDMESLLINSQGNNVGGVVVVGEPGAGKSALSAQLICSRSSNPYIHKRIIGYHLCKYSDKATQDPGRFVRNLVDLIARRIPEYGMLIHNSSFIPGILQRSCLRDPYDCFKQAVAIPLRQLQNEFQYYFIVIDALDECSSDDGGTSIVQFINDNYNMLPIWLRLVLTSRNDSTVLKHFRSFPKLHLSSTDGRNLQDIEVFIATKLFEDTPLLEKLKIMLGLSKIDEVSYLTSKLLSQSQGNFHFAKEMLHFWKSDPRSVDLDKLPSTIGEQYESYLRRAYGSRQNFKPALTILEILVASFEPIQIMRLFNVLKIRETIDYEYDFIYTLKGLSHFIRYGVDNTITLYHQSFKEWLTSNENLGNPYYVSRSRGHRRLAEYHLSVVKKNQSSSMDIYHLVQHVSCDEGENRHLDDFNSIEASYINATIDNDNRTLLHLAASKSNEKVLQLLRPAFEDIDCEDSYGFTPAFVAAMNGLGKNVYFLISEGANIEHRTKPPPTPNSVWGDLIERSKTAFWNSSMIHAAASGGHSDVVQLLLKRNASFVDVNGVNLTAIQLAAEKGHLKVVQLLFEQGARLDHLSLQHAAYRGHADVVAFLLNIGVDDKCMRCDGSFYWLKSQTRYQVTPRDAKEYILSDDRFKILCQSALHLAVAKNRTKVAKVLLSREDNTIHCTDFTGRTPLHEAVRQNHFEMTELLVKNGAKLSRRCRYFQNLSFPDIVSNTEKCVSRNTRYSLSEEEEMNYNRDLCHCGSTPFLLAARYGHIEVASLLLRYGAKPLATDCQGATPLHVAACHGHYRFIKWLILQRPYLHVNLRSKNQSTLLHSAVICQNNKDIKPLLDMGVSIYDTDQYGMTPLHYSVLNSIKVSGTFTFQTAPMFDTSPNIFIWTPEWDFTLAHGSGIRRRVPINFQCLKLLEIVKLADDIYINKGDKKSRTALHLAAKTGDECSVMQLLRIGARTDLTDNEERTPLDVAIEFAPEELDLYFHKKGIANMEKQWANIKENFDLVRAFNRRNQNSVANILLSREAFLTQTCDERQTSLLHRAFEKEKPFIADLILSKGGRSTCKDKEGRTPLLIYLQNGGKWLDVVLTRFNVKIDIECGKPFNVSEFHLVAFRKPTIQSDNLLEWHSCDACQCFSEDGPLAEAINAHPRGFRVIDECLDAEGYTALHRAAQGGNLLVLEKFLSWGADPTILTPQGHTALNLAIMSGLNLMSCKRTRYTAEKAADLLLRATRRKSLFDVGCNSGEASLTIYHLSAYAGLTGFVKTLLNDKRLYGIDVNCSNVHGITPLYLAKLFGGIENISNSTKDPWQEIVSLIEMHGGVLSYPDREVELHVLYKHLFGSYPDPFTLDPLEANSEQLYKSGVSQCGERDLDYYNTGTMINPYEEAVHTELLRTIHLESSGNKNFQLIPRQLEDHLKTLLAVQEANLDLSRLTDDVVKGFEKTNLEIARRQSEANTPTTADIQVPKSIIIHIPTIMERFLTLMKGVKDNEEQLREIRFSYESRAAIISHWNKYLKDILHKHSGVYGDTRNVVKLIEKYEESALCLEEIFQTSLLRMKFANYVSRSRVSDYLSFQKNSLDKTEFTSKRIPLEWMPGNARFNGPLPWNQATRFLYEQATQRYFTLYNYLQVLSLGQDKDTRIPLSVDTLFRLS